MSKIRILLIDDEEIITTTVKFFLEEFDYEVDTANSGETGIQKFQKYNYSLVITDLMMPGLTGYDVIKKIHNISPNTPTIVASGAGKVNDAIEAIKTGAWDYLTKPIEDLDILRLTVERVLEKAALVKENKEYQQNLEELVVLKTRDLEHTITELNENRESLKLILNSIGDMILVTNLSGVVLKINPAVEKALQLSESEILGNPINELLALEEENRDIFKKAIELLQLKDSTSIGEISTTICDKQLTLTGTVAALEGDESGLNDGAVIVLTNISEHKDLEKRLYHSQKMEAVGRLASGISQDFRNVLNDISTVTESVIEETESEIVADKMRSILTSTKRAGSLIDNLLSFSSEEHDKELNLIDLNALILETKEILSRTLHDKLIIETKLTNDDCSIEGDVTVIQNSLINLALNARDAMDSHGTISITSDLIELSEEMGRFETPPVKQGKYVSLSVSDTGIGIPSDIIGSIFEPFFTTKAANQGSGLGLTTVYGMVQSHNGSISVKSKIGEGTIFTILLPLKENPINTSPQPEQSLEGITILSIEDDETAHLVLKSILLKAEATVISANSGYDSVGKYADASDEIDIVILNFNIVDMDPWECIDSLKLINPNVKVILSSGAEISYITIKEEAVKGTIIKPFKLDILTKTIIEALK